MGPNGSLTIDRRENSPASGAVVVARPRSAFPEFERRVQIIWCALVLALTMEGKKRQSGSRLTIVAASASMGVASPQKN
jgi:hypothetical protein